MRNVLILVAAVMIGSTMGFLGAYEPKHGRTPPGARRGTEFSETSHGYMMWGGLIFGSIKWWQWVARKTAT